MSVRYGINNGRTKRNLKTPEYTILNFRDIESKAMSPKKKETNSKAYCTLLVTLLLMISFSTLSIYGIFTLNTSLIYFALGLMLFISMWIFLQM